MNLRWVYAVWFRAVWFPISAENLIKTKRLGGNDVLNDAQSL